MYEQRQDQLHLPSDAWLQDMMSMPCESTPNQLSIHAASAMASSSLHSFQNNKCQSRCLDATLEGERLSLTWQGCT